VYLDLILGTIIPFAHIEGLVEVHTRFDYLRVAVNFMFLVVSIKVILFHCSKCSKNEGRRCLFHDALLGSVCWIS
jgi:hypothetical protein